MRIVYIAAGAGGMYCGACQRDITLVRGLIARGHDALLVPLYTPLRSDTGELPGAARVFFGGLNVYLQQISPVFRKLPRFVERLFDSPSLLRVLSKFALETDPKDLGPMTVSVLQGEEGRQRKEIDKLLEFLATMDRPDVINLTNSLLSGIAPASKRTFSAPIFCTLQGEDIFVGDLPEPYRTEVREQIQRNAAAIDAFIAPSKGYAATMKSFLDVDESRINLVRPGVDVNLYTPEDRRSTSRLTIGYLSRILPSKGLDLLVEAFCRLVKDGADVRLRVVGEIADKSFWRGIRAKVDTGKFASRFEYCGELSIDDKLKFLRACDVFCLPSRIPETRGMAVLEAMSTGAPAVVPDHGIFPELIELTSGGVCFRREDVDDLTEKIRGLLVDAEKRERMGRAARRGVVQHFSADRMVEETLEVYGRFVSDGRDL